MTSAYKTPFPRRSPSGSPRSPSYAAISSKSALASVFVLELIACFMLVIKSHEATPSLPSVYQIYSEPVQEGFMLPIVPDVAPEYGHFFIDTCTTDLICSETLTVTHSSTFVHALQLCMGSSKCGGVLFDPVWKTTTLCKALVDDTKGRTINRKMLPLNEGEGSCMASGKRKRRSPPHPCPGSSSQCLVMDSFELQSGFNDQAQQLTELGAFSDVWQEKPTGFRAYNPGLVEYKGEWYASLRLSNWTYCPWQEHPMSRIRRQGGSGVQSTTVMCQLSMPVLSLRLDTCTFLPSLPTEALVLPANVSMTYAVPHLIGKGIEDMRPFVHAGKLRLTGNRRSLVDGTVMTEQQKREARLAGKEASIVVDMEMGDDMLMSRDAHGLECDVELDSPMQKNWMPLSVGEDLYYVTRLSPLTVVKIDTAANGSSCSLAFQEAGLLPNYNARTIRGGLRGGSSFISLDNTSTTFLGLAHSRQRALTYHHHFVVLRRPSPGRFEVGWVSEAFRLPRSHDFLPSGGHKGVQFSMSIARYVNDLVLSYGDGDCDAHVAVAPDFFKRLYDYMNGGIGTHKISWNVHNEQIRL